LPDESRVDVVTDRRVDVPPIDRVECSSDIECNDGLFCNGPEMCLDGRCRLEEPFVPCADRCRCDERTDSCICEMCAPFETSCTNNVDDDCNRFTDCADPVCRMDPGCRMCEDVEVVCDNLRDDDCDGARDCRDMDCVGRPECEAVCSDAETQCNDGIDDDCDRLVDCDDDECIGHSRCDCCSGRVICPPLSEQFCGNRLNDDCDQFVDCDDSECTGDPFCSAIPCPRADLGSRLGDSIARGAVFGDATLTGSCGGAGPEFTYRWRAPVTATYIIDTLGSAVDTVLYLKSSCGGMELAGGCNDDSGGTLQSRIVIDLDVGALVIIVVDSQMGSIGEYVLNLRIQPAGSERGQCNDGIDNDGDGRVDCRDSDCAMDPVCCVGRPEICDNGTDDDCNMLIDCADMACTGSPECCMPIPESCTNGSDDDCDMLIDCADPSCAGDLVCMMTCTTREIGIRMCTDTRDNDCDRQTDCADPDCTPFGVGTECCNGIDDDGDLQVDIFTCRCFSDVDCVGVGSLEQVCWTDTLSVCAPRCNFYGGTAFCRMFDPSWVCNRMTGQCHP